MSLKAGRVGVNPADVDPINGHISPESISAYTKQEADAKFETQEAASLLQSKTLAVPISMLDGSKLTVESALQGLNTGKGSFMGLSESAFTDFVEGSEVESNQNHLLKFGKVVYARLNLTKITATAWTTVIAKISADFAPKYGLQTLVYVDGASPSLISVDTAGSVKVGANLSNNMIRLTLMWITN